MGNSGGKAQFEAVDLYVPQYRTVGWGLAPYVRISLYHCVNSDTSFNTPIVVML